MYRCWLCGFVKLFPIWLKFLLKMPFICINGFFGHRMSLTTQFIFDKHQRKETLLVVQVSFCFGRCWVVIQNSIIQNSIQRDHLLRRASCTNHVCWISIVLEESLIGLLFYIGAHTHLSNIAYIYSYIFVFLYVVAPIDTSISLSFC